MRKRHHALIAVALISSVLSCSPIWPLWPFRGGGDNIVPPRKMVSLAVPEDLQKFDFVGQASFVRSEPVDLETGQSLPKNVTGGVWRITVNAFVNIQGIDPGGTRPRSPMYVYSIDQPPTFKPREQVYVYGYYGKSDGRLWGSCRSVQQR